MRLAVALLLSTALTAPSLVAAQTPPPAVPADPQAEVNVPSRVGWLASVYNAVSFRATGSTQWSQAAQNSPLVAGNALWTQPDAQAEADVSSSRVVMNGATELDIAALDPNAVTLTLPRGEIYLHPAALGSGEVWTVQTPRGSIALKGDGRYGIVAGDTENPTTITVIEGQADDPNRHAGFYWHGRPGTKGCVPDRDAGARQARARKQRCGAAGTRRDSWLRAADRLWNLEDQPAIRHGLVSAGSAGLGAIPARALGLRGAVGLDLGG
jgi:hypothetical protein